MISDDDLYRIAIFLGSAAMILIILYHYVEVNATEDSSENEKAPLKQAQPAGKQTGSTKFGLLGDSGHHLGG
ncbi:hypothetical protein NKR23_g4446 [Pleurostoma richardsiae]|uniref:Dolichyl-diphosphooligosaccharide--protein glycosyltransferase subunit 4 n=1 Tax=Pleurostoma richardsiae TaxID=41990 RepID=A0AA38RRN1_9PEZI|nr:hypothetical protein NKR23_g4446 [Pleurostoma richardsiae]